MAEQRSRVRVTYSPHLSFFIAGVSTARKIRYCFFIPESPVLTDRLLLVPSLLLFIFVLSAPVAGPAAVVSTPAPGWSTGTVPDVSGLLGSCCAQLLNPRSINAMPVQ